MGSHTHCGPVLVVVVEGIGGGVVSVVGVTEIAVIGAPPVAGTPVTTGPLTGAVGMTSTGGPPLVGTATTGAVLPDEGAGAGVVAARTGIAEFGVLSIVMPTPRAIPGSNPAGTAGNGGNCFSSAI